MATEQEAEKQVVLAQEVLVSASEEINEAEQALNRVYQSLEVSRAEVRRAHRRTHDLVSGYRMALLDLLEVLGRCPWAAEEAPSADVQELLANRALRKAVAEAWGVIHAQGGLTKGGWR